MSDDEWKEDEKEEEYGDVEETKYEDEENEDSEDEPPPMTILNAFANERKISEEKDDNGFIMTRNKNKHTKKKKMNEEIPKTGTISRAERFNYKPKDEKKPKYKNYLEELKSTTKKSTTKKSKNAFGSTDLSNSMFMDNFHKDDDISVVDEDELDKITQKIKQKESSLLDENISLFNEEEKENDTENEEKKEEEEEVENNSIANPRFNPFKLFITLQNIVDIPSNLGIKSIYLSFQLSCGNPSDFEKSNTIRIYNNNGKWEENTVIELKCLRPLEGLMLKVLLYNAETNHNFAYINFPLNQQIPNPIEFTFYRDIYSTIPKLSWEIETDENKDEVKNEVADDIEKKNIPQLTFESIDEKSDTLSSYIMSYKYNLYDEDILKSRFNLKVHYEEGTGSFYFLFYSLSLGCDVGKKVTQEDLIIEFQLGLSLLNDFNDIYEQKMRNYLLADADIDEKTTVIWILRRLLIIIDDKKCYLTHETKKLLNNNENENPYYIQPDPIEETKNRLDFLRKEFEFNNNVKEKIYIVDNVLKDVAQSKIPAVTFDMDSLEKAAKLSGSLCRPRKEIEPSLQYKFDLKIDKEKAARIQKKAREIVNKARKDIEMDEIEYQLRVKREMQEEMRLLNLVEKHRIDDIKRREEREIQKLQKDAENYAKYMKTQRRIQREQYHSMIRDTRLTTFGIGNIKGSYFGPAPIIKDTKIKPSETVNDEYYYDENGRKHKRDEKMTVTLRNNKLLESPFTSADEKRGRLVEKQLFNTIQNMGNDYNYCDIYSPFSPYKDKDSGDISYSEFRLGLESLSIHLEDWQLDAISDFYDKHGTGKVNLDKFYYSYFTRKQSKQWENMRSNIGKIFNKDQLIKKNDLRNKLRLNNIHQPNYEFNQLMSILDHGKEGLIKVNDFIKFLDINPNLIDYETKDDTIKLDYSYRSTRLIENDGVYEETKKELERLKQKQKELEDLYDF